MPRGFLLGTVLGIALSSIASFASHMFWYYLIPESWRNAMNPLAFSMIQGVFSLFMILIVLIIYVRIERKSKKHEDELEEARTIRIINAINANIINAINNQTGAILKAIQSGGQSGNTDGKQP